MTYTDDFNGSYTVRWFSVDVDGETREFGVCSGPAEAGSEAGALVDSDGMPVRQGHPDYAAARAAAKTIGIPGRPFEVRR